MKVEYHPAIEAELRAIHHYYEERSPGLGGAFIDEFERQVLQLSTRPSDGWGSRGISVGA